MVFLKRSWEGTASWPRSASNAGSPPSLPPKWSATAVSWENDEKATCWTLQAYRDLIKKLMTRLGARTTDGSQEWRKPDPRLDCAAEFEA